METTIYFVRHAESIYVEGNDRNRGLSEAGIADTASIREILQAEGVGYYLSSPYERSIATIRPAANACQQPIRIEEHLRERAIGDFYPASFTEAKRRVYQEPRFAYPNGESSIEAQNRAVRVVANILETYEGSKIAIGTHGDIMTLMLGFFDERYGFDFWQSTSMPDIYRAVFDKRHLLEVTRLWEG